MKVCQFLIFIRFAIAILILFSVVNAAADELASENKLTSVTQLASADKDNEKELSLDAIKQCKIMSRQAAISSARMQTGGKVVSIELKRDAPVPHYLVRVLVNKKRIKNLVIKACI